MKAAENVLKFSIPMLPPSVNHYVTHGGGKHRKTEIAKAWERDFMAMLPADVRTAFVAARAFSVTLRIVPGPNDKGDIDNFPKMILDCIAKAGMLRHRATLAPRSDSWIKALHVYVDDGEEDRKEGPRTWVTIEAYERHS